MIHIARSSLHLTTLTALEMGRRIAEEAITAATGNAGLSPMMADSLADMILGHREAINNVDATTRFFDGDPEGIATAAMSELDRCALAIRSRDVTFIRQALDDLT